MIANFVVRLFGGGLDRDGRADRRTPCRCRAGARATRSSARGRSCSGDRRWHKAGSPRPRSGSETPRRCSTTATSAACIPWTLATLAQALGAAGDGEGATEAVDELMAVRPPGMHHIDIDIELGRAWAAAARGERSQAREIAEKIGRALIDDGRTALGALALHDALRLGTDPSAVIDGLDDAATRLRRPAHRCLRVRTCTPGPPTISTASSRPPTSSRAQAGCCTPRSARPARAALPRRRVSGCVSRKPCAGRRCSLASVRSGRHTDARVISAVGVPWEPHRSGAGGRVARGERDVEARDRRHPVPVGAHDRQPHQPRLRQAGHQLARRTPARPRRRAPGLPRRSRASLRDGALARRARSTTRRAGSAGSPRASPPTPLGARAP